MAQADLNVANQSFPATRADLNNQLLALGTFQSGASAPSTTYAYMPWADTTTGIFKIRNAANSGWIELYDLDGTDVYSTNYRSPVDNSLISLNGGQTGGANIELYGPSHASLANLAYYDAATHIFRSVDGTSQYGQFTSTGLYVGAAGTGPVTVALGAGATGNRYAYVDLIGDATYTSYGVRFIRNNGGANTTSALLHRGTGSFNIDTQDGGDIVLQTSSTTRLTINGTTGLVTCNNGIAGTITRGTAVTPGAVTSVSFTSIPSWVKRITLTFSGISLTGTDHFLIRLSTGGTFATTGYTSGSSYTTLSGSGSTSSTAGAVLFAGTAANILTGSYTFVNLTGNTWVGTGIHIYDNDAEIIGNEASKVTLSGTLDGIRILSSGSNNFDAGTINVTYEG